MENKNLWAPWRIRYVQGLDKDASAAEKKTDCFICHNIKNQPQDDENLVLWRTDKCIVNLNRYPYNNGHLLIAPIRHVPDLENVNDQEMLELIKLVRDSQKVLLQVIRPQGFNVGMNFGRCAGAGLPCHLHIHVVPRWDGDTSFMDVCADTDVISQSLNELLELLKKISRELNLPNK